MKKLLLVFIVGIFGSSSFALTPSCTLGPMYDTGRCKKYDTRAERERCERIVNSEIQESRLFAVVTKSGFQLSSARMDMDDALYDLKKLVDSEVCYVKSQPCIMAATPWGGFSVFNEKGLQLSHKRLFHEDTVKDLKHLENSGVCEK